MDFATFVILLVGPQRVGQMIAMGYLLISLAAYLLGSIPSGFLIGKARGVDLRKHGSGNIGATNALRVLGKKWGYLCFACDIGKGALATMLAKFVAAPSLGLSPDAAGILGGIFVVVGHNFPVWLGFKGGKGIATSGGVVFGLFPFAFLVGAAVWFALFGMTRYVSVASVGGAISLPITLCALWLTGQASLTEFLVGLGLAILAVWRHRSNIQRLLAGTEPRFERKKVDR